MAEDHSDTSSALAATDSAPTTFANLNRDDSPLLRLPPELRNHTYSYLFKSATSYHDGCHRRWVVVDDLPLAQTCRQIRSETAGLLSSYKTLTLHEDHENLELWADQCWAGHAPPDTLLMPPTLLATIDWQMYVRGDESVIWKNISVVQSLFRNVQRVVIIGWEPQTWNRAFSWGGSSGKLKSGLRRAFGRRDLVVNDEQEYRSRVGLSTRA